MSLTRFYSQYPQDAAENLRWRIRCRERALDDLHFRHSLYDACMEDPLFWMGFAMWSLEPRARVKIRPFIPWCLAGGTLVVTDRGLVPIEEVGLHYLVWDGTMWVQHDGCAYRGERETISAYGIELTPDHQVMTTEGWRDACIEGLDREDIRLPGGYREKWLQGPKPNVVMPMPMRRGEGDTGLFANEGSHEELRLLSQGEDDEAWHESEHHVHDVGEHDPTMHESACNEVSSSWWARNPGMRSLAEVSGVFRGHGREARGIDSGANQQRRELRARQLQMGHPRGANEQYSIESILCDISGSVHDGPDCEDRRCSSTDDRVSREGWCSRGRTVESATPRPQAVYDLLNCGPTRAFTVIDSDGLPLLVHNCHQESVFVAIDKAIDDAASEDRSIDVILDKSRAQGGTFGYLWLHLRRWLRDPMFSAGYVTRNEALVDSATDADTLFWKLAWAIERLPFWMVPAGFNMKQHRSLSNHSFLNPSNGATLVGYAAGQDVGAGGRKTTFCADEFGARDFISGGKDEAVMAALHDVTNNILLVSARYADSGVFHEACEDTSSSGLHLILDWKDNPIHGKHSYRVLDGKPEALKEEDQATIEAYHVKNPDLQRRLERKGFKYGAVVRSPWYDMRCLRPTSTPRLIASQLDRDPRGAVGKVFPSDLLDRVKRTDCKLPVWRGTPVFDSETLQMKGLIARDDGPLKLWFRPGPDNSCPLGPYTLGCDMAIGSDGAYASNSVVSGIDNRTGWQVLEYAIKGMPLVKFADIAVGLAKWLRTAFLGWEDSGMAGPFRDQIMKVWYYSPIYMRTVEEHGSKKKTKKAGWWNGKDENKADLFEKMTLAMDNGGYTIRSVDLIRECGEYEWDGGKIIHQPTKNKGATEKAHGDRVISAGVAWLVYSEGLETIPIDSDEDACQPEYGSWLWRERREQPKANVGCPDFGLKDVVGY